MLSITSRRRVAQVTVAAAALTVMGTGVALACHTPAKPADHKVGICHATGSATNPYVFIQVDEHAEKAHANHQDGRDIVGVKSAADCPKPAPKQTPAPKASPSPAPAGQGQVLSATTLPATLPDTGASFGGSALIGLSAMTGAAAAYLKTRKTK